VNGSKRRKRGPRASDYFSFESDEPVPVPRHSVGQASAHVSAPGASCASLPNARGGAEKNGSKLGVTVRRNIVLLRHPGSFTSTQAGETDCQLHVVVKERPHGSEHVVCGKQ